ncbi:hypothetical protein EDC01DRAFT_73086 [Geopyxis carbonaria]|nr:hypothetical protein EDC01DRAFT_73086 [Geopyxis carbonaria]
MRIDSLLNSPADTMVSEPNNPQASNARNCNRVLEQQWRLNIPAQNDNTRGNSTTSSSTPPTDQNRAYSPYQQSYRERTSSTRSSYSGPSINSSTAATSPLEISLPPSHDAVLSGGRLSHDDSIGRPQFPGRDQPQPLQRILPPFTSLMNGVHQPVARADGGAVSPRSGGFPQQPQSGQQSGYFPTTSQPTPFQPYYPFSHGHSRSLSVNTGKFNTLMSLADVAMENATVEERRGSDEVIAAAKLLARRNGSGGEQRIGKVHSDEHVYGQIEAQSRVDSHHNIDPSITINRAVESELPLFPKSPQHATAHVDSIAIAPAVNSSMATEVAPPVSEYLNQPPKCSYCTVCTTGSPLRKVVSHIFGRNKLSTRQIPKNVWVYYCRKHYQRSRYRNPRGFARQQVLLVKRQCERLEQWGGVKDWVIKVRRREELRMGREDNTEDFEDAEDDIEEELAAIDYTDAIEAANADILRRTAAARRASAEANANWIIRHTGGEKTIHDVYSLLERIEVEVQQNGGKFPDVELLPNVDLDLANPIDTGPEGISDSLEEGHHSASKASKRLRPTISGGHLTNDPTEPNTKKPKSSVSAMNADPATIHARPRSMAARPHSNIDWQNAAYDTSLVRNQPITPPETSPSESRRSSSWEIDVNIRSAPPLRGFPGPRQPPIEEYVAAPRRSTRSFNAPQNHPLYNGEVSPSSALGKNDFTPRQLCAIAGEPLHRFPLRKSMDMSVYEDNFDHRNGEIRSQKGDARECLKVNNFA